MAAEKKTEQRQRAQNIYLENRSSLSVTGVTDVDSFDETAIVLYTDNGALVIRGENLHIARIDLESGELAVEGEVSAVLYDQARVKGGFFSRLLR